MMNYYLKKIREEYLLYKIRRNRNIFINEKQLKSLQFFFIISCGRSGTTLLRKLLMEKGNIHIPPESYDGIPNLVELYYKNRSKSWDKKVEISLDFFSSQSFFEFWNLDFTECRDKLVSIKLEDQNLHSIITLIYSHHRDTYNSTADYIGDKTPYLVLRNNWIELLFPNSKIINVVRDGRDVVYSRMKSFNENLETSINRWKWAMQGAKKYKKFYGENFIEIKYEDLIDRPDEILNKILNFLNIEVSDEICDKEISLGDQMQSHHANLNKPINRNAIGKWVMGLSEVEKSKVENELGKYLKDYNYL